MAFVDTVNSLSNILLHRESPVELSITNNTVTIDPNSGSYFFLDGIDSNLNINISSLSASSKTIYLRLNFIQDNVVINWPSNIKWQEISSPSISQYEDLFISLMTLDGGTTWYSEPVIKTKPFVDCTEYMKNTHPSTFSTLTSLPISDSNYFGSIRPISLAQTFRNCSSLTSLDVSNFDTTNVTNMRFMFSECSSLTSLNVSNFDTTNVTDMSNVFSYCSSLTSLDLSNWDTSNVTEEGTREIFYNCRLLEYLIIGSSTFKFRMRDSDCGNLNTTCKILVPSALLNTYKYVTNWSSIASQFDAIENYTITRSNGQVTVTPNS